MKNMLKKQGWHLLYLVLLLAAAFIAIMRRDFRAGQLWGISTPVWYWIAIFIPVVHQVFVLLVWRAELYAGWISKTFGRRGFTSYGIIFIILFAARPVSVILLAVANSRSLALSWPWRILLGLVLFVPSAYLGYSVVRYFGLKRALGADHFFESYRDLPMVKEGIFKYSNNGMYLYGFFLLWAVAVLTASKAALAAAAFNHLYIWVHYYTTEKPDMQYIYGD